MPYEIFIQGETDYITIPVQDEWDKRQQKKMTTKQTKALINDIGAALDHDRLDEIRKDDTEYQEFCFKVIWFFKTTQARQLMQVIIDKDEGTPVTAILAYREKGWKESSQTYNLRPCFSTTDAKDGALWAAIYEALRQFRKQIKKDSHGSSFVRKLMSQAARTAN